MKMTLVRQGDVLLRPTRRKVSASAKTVTDKGRTILAYGEVTGHAHEVIAGTDIERHQARYGDDVPPMQLFEEPDGSRLLVVRGPATLRHEEHGPIALVPGHYEVIRQREYAPGALRFVAD